MLVANIHELVKKSRQQAIDRVAEEDSLEVARILQNEFQSLRGETLRGGEVDRPWSEVGVEPRISLVPLRVTS